MSFNPSSDFKTQTDFNPSCSRHLQKILQFPCPRAHPCLSAGTGGSAPFPPYPYVTAVAEQPLSPPCPSCVPTSISCTCSSLVAYICCRESSSSLFRSSSVFPSSAANCKSEKQRDKAAALPTAPWLGVVGSPSAPKNDPTPSTAAHFSWHWFYWHVLTCVHIHRNTGSGLLSCWAAGTRGGRAQDSAAPPCNDDLVLCWLQTLLQYPAH